MDPSFHPPRAEPATPHPPNPGAAPVGRVLDLTPLELQVAIYLRLWCSGPRGQAEVWQDLVARLGSPEAAGALKAFEDFVRAVLVAARRPLSRHAVDCPCLGGDEATIVRVVVLAAAGEPEEAGLLLSWLVAPSAVARASALAEDLGLRLVAGSLPPRSYAGSAPAGRPDAS